MEMRSAIGALVGLALGLTLMSGCAPRAASARPPAATPADAPVASQPAAPAPVVPAPVLLPPAELERRASVVRLMGRVVEWQLANPSSHRPDEWHVAPFWIGITKFAPLSAEPRKYLDALRANGAANGWKPGPRPLHAEDHAITQSYLLVHGIDKDLREITPTLARFDEMLKQPFAEPLDFTEAKMSREWVWADALFMSPPALTLAAQTTGDRRYLDLMHRLWWKTTDYLYDKQEHLFFRDSRYFDQREPNGRKVFWSRGNGWVMAGLARVIDAMPPADVRRPNYISLFREMATRLVALQQSDGYWRASLLDPDSLPMPETSGTALFTYALAWGVNAGVLDGASFDAPVRLGWAALVRAVGPDGRLGSVQKPGVAPAATRVDDTEVYAVGALLLAGAEMFRLAPPRTGLH
jgi:unsaturated rhamnogalacturonyl hydrolase